LLGTRSLAQQRSSNSDDMAGILMIAMPALDKRTLELKA
jgi:hypothetical protein